MELPEHYSISHKSERLRGSKCDHSLEAWRALAYFGTLLDGVSSK